MKLDVAKADLQHLRDALHNYRIAALKLPCPPEDTIGVARKVIREINGKLTKVHGHDCNGAYYEK